MKQGERGRFKQNLSFEEFEYYRLIMKAVAYSILKNEGEADEVVSEALLYMCEKMPIAEDIPLEAQVRTIARSRAINRYKSSFWRKIAQGGYRFYRRDKEDNEYEDLPAALIDMGPEEHLLGDEFAALVSKAAQQLKEPLRICFTLNYEHSMKPAEIAHELKLTRSVVYKRLEAAMKQVTQFVQSQENHET